LPKAAKYAHALSSGQGNSTSERPAVANDRSKVSRPSPPSVSPEGASSSTVKVIEGELQRVGVRIGKSEEIVVVAV
jgi:hypothetical protein